MTAALAAFWADLKGVFLASPAAIRANRRGLFLALIAGLAVAGVFSALFDADWAAAGDAPFGKGAVPAGRAISYYGELHWAPLISGLLLWIAGYATHRVRWRDAAAAALLAAALAGAVAAGLKGLVGRPRPTEGRPFELVGPNLNSDTQGFPSGHTTHNTAFAVTLCALAPEVGVPALVLPASAAWARMALHKHYPSDIAGGATFGVMGAIVAASSVRRRREKKSAS